MKKFNILILVLCCSITGFAQFSFTYIDTIEVIKNSSALESPWVGGFNSPQFSEIDLNKDGIMDLFVFDKADNTIKTFLNDGIVGTPSYTYAPIYEQYFPTDLESFAILADYNNDGKPDIFSYAPGSMKLYKNVTEYNIPQFEIYFPLKIPATIFGGLSNVYCYVDDIPGLFDVDEDGDLDILSFHLGGLEVDYFENQTPAGEDTLILERVSSCWGQFYEHPQLDSIVLLSCKRSSSNASRHTGSTISLLHLDNNGLLDIVLGDVESHNLNALYNTGSASVAKMTTVEYDFPSDDVPVDFEEFLGSYLVDVDNDGDKDMLVAPNDRAQSKDILNVLYYQNDGSDNDADLNFVQSDLIANELIDHGTASHPTFTDVDGDGLLDIIVGHLGYYTSYNDILFKAEYTTQLAFYHNIGTASSPRYEFITDDFANISSYGIDGAYPTFGDIDGDGDQDMLLGDVDGWIIHMENTSGPSLSPTYQMMDDRFFLLKSLASANPTLFDINGDSLLDLIVGEKDGYMKYYPNIGTSTNPEFSDTNKVDTLGGVHIFRAGYNSHLAPFFAKVDSTTYLFAGTNFGDLVIYDNIDGNLSGTFNPVDTFHFASGYLSPSLANINATDSLELLIGESTGGIRIYGAGNFELELDTTIGIIDSTIDTVGIDDLSLREKVNVFPNPTNDVINLGLRDLNGKNLSVAIHDLTGRLVFKNNIIPDQNMQIMTIPIHQLEKGIYMVTIQQGTNNSVHKVMKL